ncbi:MAG: class I SAM-dependent methyltransferase [Oscillospiraceae bacterium]|nr:class I SAM-dependent methyltransferase [Oscillospiraceae bacterium]
MSYIEKNSDAWDKNVESKNFWTLPVSAEDIENARNGKWDIVLTPIKPVPKSWFPADFKGLKVLLVAGGGGQQGPILSALGADVTVFDNSKKQLEQDEFVANRENLIIKTVQGNMQDLSAFADESFDFIMQFAGCFVDSVLPVWNETYRILKSGGSMLAGHNHPFEFIFDVPEMEKGNLVVRHKIPYSDIKDLTPEEFERVTADGVCFGHSLHDMIQGQIDAGFLIAGYYEDSGCGYVLDEYIDTFFATKAIKV